MLLTERINNPDGTQKALVPVRTLKAYLNQGRTLTIPPWQREYSWQTTEEGQVDVLLKDLHTFATDPQATEYLIGSVILCQDPSGDKSKVMLIDGQQRTLTLSLFLMCARKFMMKNDLIDGNNLKHTQLVTDLAHSVNANPHGRFSAKVSMNQNKANEILAKIWDWSQKTADVPDEDEALFNSADSQTKTQKNLAAVTEFIYKELQNDEWDNSKMIEWLVKIINGVKLIELQLDSQREAISVYDRINDRGMLLSSADLIKNILFQRVPDDRFDDISENWKSMVVSLNDCEKRARLQDPKYLLRALSAGATDAKVPYDKLVEFWVSRFDDPEQPLDPIEFSTTLSESAAKLAQLATNRYQDHALEEIFLAAELGSVQHFPVLLAGYDIEDPAVFRHLAKQVNARTVMYILGRERTQAFESLVPKWGKGVSDLGKNATINQLSDLFAEVAAPSEGLYANLRDQVLGWKYTNSTERKKLRAVIAFLSVDLNRQVGADVTMREAMRTRRLRGEQHGWDLEHIMPQNEDPSPEFQTIGNLCLLAPPDNRSASKKLPHEKDDENYYNQCMLALTKSVGKLDALVPATRAAIEGLFASLGADKSKMQLTDWDAKAVKARSDFYLEYLLMTLNRDMF
jgi:hypothetical protein